MPRRKLDCRVIKASKAERMHTALRLRAAGADFEQIGRELKIKAAAARKLVAEGLVLRREESADLADLVREEELNKLADLYKIERVKAEQFKLRRPDISTQAVKTCIAIARRQTQLKDAEPAVKIDVEVLTRAWRTRMDQLAHVIAQYVDPDTLALIEASVRMMEEGDDVAQIERRVIEADSEHIHQDGDDDEDPADDE
jgi:hypothetical protein